MLVMNIKYFSRFCNFYIACAEGRFLRLVSLLHVKFEREREREREREQIRQLRVLYRRRYSELYPHMTVIKKRLHRLRHCLFIQIMN